MFVVNSSQSPQRGRFLRKNVTVCYISLFLHVVSTRTYSKIAEINKIGKGALSYNICIFWLTHWLLGVRMVMLSYLWLLLRIRCSCCSTLSLFFPSNMPYYYIVVLQKSYEIKHSYKIWNHIACTEHFVSY